jgi:hypothetical protein
VGAGSFLVHYGQVRILTMPHKMVAMGERLCVKAPYLQSLVYVLKSFIEKTSFDLRETSVACAVGPKCEYITDFFIQTQFFAICLNFHQQNPLKN